MREDTGGIGGRRLVAAMCVGPSRQPVASRAVPAVWRNTLSPSGNLTAPKRADGQLVRHRLHAGSALPRHAHDRVDARIILSIGSGLERAGDSVIRAVRQRSPVRHPDLGGWQNRLRRRLHAGVSRPSPTGWSRRTLRERDALPQRSPSGRASHFSSRSWLADTLGWRARSISPALGPLAMIAAALGMAPVQVRSSPRPLFDSSRFSVTASHSGMCSAMAPTASELYALRTWIVAFWTMSHLATTARRCSGEADAPQLSHDAREGTAASRSDGNSTDRSSTAEPSLRRCDIGPEATITCAGAYELEAVAHSRDIPECDCGTETA